MTKARVLSKCSRFFSVAQSEDVMRESEHEEPEQKNGFVVELSSCELCEFSSYSVSL